MSKKSIVILTGVHPNKVSGRAVIDLKNLLKSKDHRVVIITYSFLKSHLEDVISMQSFPELLRRKVYSRLKSLFVKKRKVNPDYYMYDCDSHTRKFDVSKILKKLPFDPDAFIYLFPHNFLNEESLYNLNKLSGAPIYRYMADMAEITGGCHYAWNCEGYMKSCGNCPGLYSNDPKDETFLNLKFKKKFIEKTDVYPIAASEWQFRQLLKSSLYSSSKCYKILSPTNDEMFCIGNKNEVRAKLKLPLNKKIVFFGSVNNSEKRKGRTELNGALIHLRGMLTKENLEGIHLLVAGRNIDEDISSLGFSITTLGYVEYAVLANAYQAADVFLCPSVEDSGPTMINQSLMCGTPVVSFEMGVAPDLVIKGKTGYAASLFDSKDLAYGLKMILDLNIEKQKEYSVNCRAIANDLCSYNVIAEKFDELFQA